MDAKNPKEIAVDLVKRNFLFNEMLYVYDGALRMKRGKHYTEKMLKYEIFKTRWEDYGTHIRQQLRYYGYEELIEIDASMEDMSRKGIEQVDELELHIITHSIYFADSLAALGITMLVEWQKSIGVRQ